MKKKNMILMLAIVGLLFGGIFGYQMFKGHMMKKFFANKKEPIVSVSTMTVTSQSWQSKIKAAGSLRAVQGVNVTTEIAGMVRTIEFSPGAKVNKNALLVKLNDDTEVAQLDSLVAQAELAKITYARDKAQFNIKAVSQATLDNDASNLKSLQAQVAQQQSIVAKKNIRAPFTGRLGISYINPGQYVNPGDKIVSLQSLDPIYVDFYLPQQSLVQIAKGQTVSLTFDSFKGKTFTGKITTINPVVDSATRNVEVEATLPNPKEILFPGMFTTVEVSTGKPQQFLTLPQSAISYNPYGEIIYLVKEQGINEKGEPLYIASQKFVKAGEVRGDQVAILDGLSEGDIVVTSGQLKLKNGSKVYINNSVEPSNDPNPKPIDA